MNAATFTREGSRIVIRPGSGAWSREIHWSQTEARADECLACPSGLAVSTSAATRRDTWTTDIADDGACIRYTLIVTPLPLDPELWPRVMLRIEAHEEGAQHHGPHAVVVAAEWGPVSERGLDHEDLLEQSSGSIRARHHWVALALRLSAPMDGEQARSLFDTASMHFTKSEARLLACLACPPVGLAE